MKPQNLRLLPLAFVVCCASTAAVAADAPTFYADALPVFQKNCIACHQENPPDVGGISAPFSLADFEQARIWAPLIRRAVETGYMPPWGAHERHKGQFLGERYLEKAEKALILAWVDGGALPGDPADAQRNANRSIEVGGTVLPPSGWWIGDPDLVVQFEQPGASARPG